MVKTLPILQAIDLMVITPITRWLALGQPPPVLCDVMHMPRGLRSSPASGVEEGTVPRGRKVRMSDKEQKPIPELKKRRSWLCLEYFGADRALRMKQGS